MEKIAYKLNKPSNMKYYILLYLFLLSGIICAQNTYKLVKTEYYSNQYYKSGQPKVKQSQANEKEFLKSKGYNKTPKDYEVDHIVLLSQGGTDSPSNMQLLTKEEHRQKENIIQIQIEILMSIMHPRDITIETLFLLKQSILVHSEGNIITTVKERKHT